jgi:transcription termination/antitermination protein NusG
MEENLSTEKKWYALRTYSGHENKVKAYIENETKVQNLSHKLFNVLIPAEKVFEIKNGKKRTKVKNFFPGYILIETILDKETKHLILNTPSVLSFVGPKAEPVPLQYEEVKRILGKIDERKDREVAAVPFRVGDAVKVTGGPFSGFNGFIQEVSDEKMKVKVMVSIFGRKTPVELDFGQIEIEK